MQLLYAQDLENMGYKIFWTFYRAIYRCAENFGLFILMQPPVLLKSLRFGFTRKSVLTAMGWAVLFGLLPTVPQVTREEGVANDKRK